MVARSLRLAMLLVLIAAPVAAQDLGAQARALLGQGLKPEAVALELVARGAYPEDAAATLFDLVPAQIRAVSFAMVRAGASATPDDALPLAADIAGRAQPAAVPAAAAMALSVPDQVAPAATALSQAVPQAAPLIAATMARLVPARGAEIAAAAARAVPPQAAFVASAVSLALPQAKDAIFAAVGAAVNVPPARVAVLAEASEAVGANAIREADEALAGLPLAAR